MSECSLVNKSSHRLQLGNDSFVCILWEGGGGGGGGGGVRVRVRREGGRGEERREGEERRM